MSEIKLKKGSDIELEITALAFGGLGIAKVNDFVIFVERTIPGDKVTARIRKKKSSFAEAYVLDYHERGSGYVKPECRYHGTCGGCKWQFLDYEKQLEFKQFHVEDAIQRIGGIENLAVEKTLPSPEIFAYRNKMEFSFSDNRWLLKEELGDESIDKSFALGLHVPGAYNKILDIDYCHLQDEIFNKILNRFKSFVKSSDLPVYNLKSHEGVWRFLMLRKGVHSNEYMINIVTSEPIDKIAKGFIKELVDEIPEITSIVNNLNRRKAQIAIGEEEIVLHGKAIIHEKLDDFEFEISANSFFQTNTKQAEKLYQYVKNLASEHEKKIVFDLYSGTGTIPIYLSDSVDHIYGFELVETAVENARENVDKLGISNCTFVCGDIKDTLPEYKHLEPDFLIVDPPRAGMHNDVVNAILELNPKAIIYVSCNPTTLARDLSLLKQKYHIKLVQPFDMFPHTYHIETVVHLNRIEGENSELN